MVKQFAATEVGEVLQRIYDSEVNVKLYWKWDSGFDWEIEDEKNGFQETSRVDASISNNEWGKIEYSVTALAYEIYRLFPTSNFGKWYATLDRPAPLEKIKIL